jgi:2-C-methyl-D-erythritol 4-phosphate cytidylyltransferase
VRKIDAVINTAAILIKKPIQQMTAQEISTVVNTNLVGAINVAIASRSYLTESHGCLVNFTSSSYTRGRAFYAAYSSTKCAVVNLSQALSEEWAPVGIRVFCINPERTATPMRLTNFGIEDPSTLLTSDDVAQKTLQTILSSYTGLIVDVRQKM